MLKLTSDLARRGYDIYKKHRRELETRHWGEFVAIEVKSGKYFLGSNMAEALDKAEEKFPEAKFLVLKVGELAAVNFKQDRFPEPKERKHVEVLTSELTNLLGPL